MYNTFELYYKTACESMMEDDLDFGDGSLSIKSSTRLQTFGKGIIKIIANLVRRILEIIENTMLYITKRNREYLVPDIIQKYFKAAEKFLYACSTKLYVDGIDIDEGNIFILEELAQKFPGLVRTVNGHYTGGYIDIWIERAYKQDKERNGALYLGSQLMNLLKRAQKHASAVRQKIAFNSASLDDKYGFTMHGDLQSVSKYAASLRVTMDICDVIKNIVSREEIRKKNTFDEIG